MDIKEIIKEKLVNIFKKLGYDENLAVVSNSSRPEIADFQCNSSFQLSKLLGKNPQIIANNIIENLQDLKDLVEVSFVPPAFINFTLKERAYSLIADALINDENLGLKQADIKENIIMDYGGANVAKELHAGHLRSPIIGESMKRLFKAFGHNVISDSHLGDWGLQMGLTIAQLYHEGVLDYYFNKSKVKPKITLSMLNEAYPRASKRKNEEPEFKILADEFTLKVQKKEEPFYTIYKELRSSSLVAIKENYANLNAHFDLWLGESDAEPYLEQTIEIFKKKNLARISDGALVVDVAKEGEHVPIPKKDPSEPQLYKNPMPPAIIQKYNEGSLYATTDLATILMRNKDYNPNSIIYFTDKRQAMHFEQVFRAAKLAGISNEKQKLIHIGFGAMKGTDGKPFKTRSGDTIKLEDIINLLETKAQEKLSQNGITDNKKLALTIGVSAMKYGDLINEASKDYVFDLDKFTSFEGRTGPYIQYTAVRIKSLLSKAGKFEKSLKITLNEEKQIILAIIKLIESYTLAYNEMSLSHICMAVYNLASAFSTFYNNIRILDEKNTEKRNTYLSISKLTLLEIEKALEILAIDIPEYM